MVVTLYTKESKPTTSFSKQVNDYVDVSALLLESGDYLLLESGDYLLLELSGATPTTLPVTIYTKESKPVTSYTQE